jgi:hypothetical protein
VKLRYLTAGLSLLLFAALFILWIRSYYNADTLRASLQNHRWHVVARSIRGSVVVSYTTTNIPVGASSFRINAEKPDPYVPFPGGHRIGPFAYTDQTLTYVITSQIITRYRILEFPHWSLLIVAAILPVLFLRRFFTERTQQLREKYACTHCGYDLRATPALCPECGHQPSSSSNR